VCKQARGNRHRRLSFLGFPPALCQSIKDAIIEINERTAVAPLNGGAGNPFLRLGLVRYQPNASPALRVSEPVIEWVQVMPERTVTAKARLKAGKVLIDAEVQGLSSQPDPGGADSRRSTERAPRISIKLLRRWAAQDGDQLGPEAVCQTQALPQACGSNCAAWNASFEIPQAEYGRKGESWSIFVEEVDRMRPAQYADEPRYETHSDDNFADTGPRFTARLALDRLKLIPATSH
jgi:hypothetical protein